MDENAKISIKVAAISINKFNEQIHHKVIQLRKFRVANSRTVNSDYEKVRKEAINSLRVIKQLKQLLIEIDHLKSRTRSEDHEKFDELICKRRTEALKEIQQYQDMKPIEKFNELSPAATSNLDDESPTLVKADEELIQVQLMVDDRDVRKRDLEAREALLREFENLQSECEEISQLYGNVHQQVVEQAPKVEAIQENVEHAEMHVEEGTRHLRQALSYKKTMYPILGGLVGACMLGPVGLVAGFKVGGAATLCGGICGYAGGKILKKTDTPTAEQITDQELQSDELKPCTDEATVKYSA